MKNIIPSAQMIAAAKNVIKCREIVESLRPTVKKIQSDLLAKIGAKDEDGNIVTDPKCAYLMADQYAEVYYTELDVEYKKAGFDLPEGYCPLLVAENNEREAVRKMNKMAEKLVPAGLRIDSEKIYNLENLKKLTELNLSYIGQFIKK